MDLLTTAWMVLDVALCIVILVSYGMRHNLPFPSFFTDIVTYGKTRADDPKHTTPWFQNLFLVPKRWFTHFYAFGLMWNMYILSTFLYTSLQEHPSLQGVLKLVPIINGNSHTVKLDCFTVLLTLALVTIQLLRRLYESLFVSSYSGRMHVGHYIVGLAFYILLNLTIVAEMPTPIHQGWCKSCLKPSSKIPWLHILAILLFVWASYHQYRCHAILGELTAWSPSGKKVYKIPHGDWFEYVSSPHYLAEIIIYLALFLMIQGPSRRSFLVVFFVISNLSLGATTTHQWYKKKFESYPKFRKIIFPYIY